MHGITVNNILPGYTRPERVEKLALSAAEREGISEAEAFAKWENEIPVKRLGEPRLSHFSFLNGQAISPEVRLQLTADGFAQFSRAKRKIKISK